MEKIKDLTKVFQHLESVCWKYYLFIHCCLW